MQDDDRPGMGSSGKDASGVPRTPLVGGQEKRHTQGARVALRTRSAHGELPVEAHLALADPRGPSFRARNAANCLTRDSFYSPGGCMWPS